MCTGPFNIHAAAHALVGVCPNASIFSFVSYIVQAWQWGEQVFGPRLCELKSLLPVPCWFPLEVPVPVVFLLRRPPGSCNHVRRFRLQGVGAVSVTPKSSSRYSPHPLRSKTPEPRPLPRKTFSKALVKQTVLIWACVPLCVCMHMHAQICMSRTFP